MAIINYPKFQAINANGDPVTGGKLYTYEVGTSDDKATYSDYTLETEHANPIVLDSLGENEIHGSGYYTLVLTDSDDTEIWTVDEFFKQRGCGIFFGKAFFLVSPQPFFMAPRQVSR